MELTVENVYQLLDSTEYTEEYLNGIYPNPHFNNRDWTDTIKLMLDSFWPGNRIKYNFLDKNKLYGAVCSSPYENIVFENATKVTFSFYYPTIICQLNKIEKDPELITNEIDPYNEEIWDDNGEIKIVKKKLKWNAEKFPILYNFLFENKNKIKEMDKDGRIYKILKILINYTYGIANNKYSLIQCDMSNMMEVTRNIMMKIEKTFPNHVLYVDTDMIFFSAFDEIKEDFIKMVEELELSYEIENFKYFIPSKIRNYIYTNSDINIRGYKIIKNLRAHKERVEEIKQRNRQRMEEKRRNNPVLEESFYEIYE